MMMRRAFTLVELMVSMVVIAILAGMVTVAVQSVQSDAKIAVCEGQVAAINELIVHRFESLVWHRFPSHARPPSPAGVSGEYRSFAQHRAQNHLISLRQLIMLELPDRKSDLPTSYLASALPSAKQLWQHQDSAASPRFAVTTSGPMPAATRYQRIIQRMTNSPTTEPLKGWTPQFESSECLYLILATTQRGGRSGLEIVPDRQIADRDGDGVPEVLDPWGNPMIFIRWPAGYWQLYAHRTVWDSLDKQQRQDHLITARNTLGQDSLDHLSVDYRLSASDPSASPEDPNARGNDPFDCRWLVVSAGPDGELDLMLRSQDSSSGWDYGDPIYYSTMAWPTGGTAPDWRGQPLPGAPAMLGGGGGYFYPDPFVSRASYCALDYMNTTPAAPHYARSTMNSGSGLPGAYFDANDDQYDNSADNIFSVPTP